MAWTSSLTNLDIDLAVSSAFMCEVLRRCHRTVRR